jgi:hypothetical protein
MRELDYFSRTGIDGQINFFRYVWSPRSSLHLDKAGIAPLM